jgi:Predicted membrane protein (DUF2306)
MKMAWGVVSFYVGLVIFTALIVWGVRKGLNKGAWLPFFVFGLAMTLFLNARYVVDGVLGGIAFFVGIFDVVVNVGAGGGERAAVVTTCANNACTVWDNTYTNHSSWAVAFHERFANGPALRTALLYGHLIFNTIAVILVTVQIMRPGRTYPGHKALGRIAIASVFISLFCAGWLTSQLSGVREYGGVWFEMGLFSMIVLVLGSATMGVAAILRGNEASHRVWMWRFAGGLWGSYWIFRAEMLLVDLMVRNVEGLTLTIPSWTSVPIGMAIAEYVRRRLDNKVTPTLVREDRLDAAGAR